MKIKYKEEFTEEHIDNLKYYINSTIERYGWGHITSDRLESTMDKLNALIETFGRLTEKYIERNLTSNNKEELTKELFYIIHGYNIIEDSDIEIFEIIKED